MSNNRLQYLGTSDTQTVYGTARLESRWTRPGTGEHDICGRNCLGRFICSTGGWAFEGIDGQVLTGEADDDPMVAVARILTSAAGRHPRAGMIGYLSYEMGYRWVGLPEPIYPETGTDVPWSQFLIYEELEFARVNKSAGYAPTPFSMPPGNRTDALIEQPHVRILFQRPDYEKALRRIKSHIANGDIYQANLTQGFDIDTALSGREIYDILSGINPAAFSAYLSFAPVNIARGQRAFLEFPAIEIVSNSPERFWRKCGHTVETRPIKGTVPRGQDSETDRRLLRGLLTSEKDRAELLMITDLERNDLGRCSRIGSVHTPALRRPRACASVWHMESTVRARVDEQTNWTDIMRCLFPGGSISGAPKRRAMEILSTCEPVPRGVYCGAVGWVKADGDADFSIAIRTATKIGSTVRICGGGGIVADSNPEQEYEESLIKIAPILYCLSGTELMVPSARRSFHAGITASP